MYFLYEFGILIGTNANTNQYQVMNDRFLVINLFIEKNPNYQNCRIKLKEQGKGLYDFILIHCINGILASVGRPDLFKTDSVKNKNKSVKMNISGTVSDLYIQEWNAKANVSSK